MSWLRQLVASILPWGLKFTPRPLNVGCVVDGGNGTDFSPSASVFFCQYHLTSAA